MKGSRDNSLYILFRKMKINIRETAKRRKQLPLKYECIFVKVRLWKAEHGLLTSFEFLNYILIPLIKINENKYTQTFLLHLL